MPAITARFALKWFTSVRWEPMDHLYFKTGWRNRRETPAGLPLVQQALWHACRCLLDAHAHSLQHSKVRNSSSEAMSDYLM